jgi:hypothetical protein
VPIADAVHQLRLVDPTNQLVEMARAVDISFGDQWDSKAVISDQ